MTAPTPMPKLSDFIAVLELEGAALLRAGQSLKQTPSLQAEGAQRALQLLAGRLQSGGKIIVAGLGKSGKIAQKIAATFSSTGSPAYFLHPTEALHGDLGLVSPQDILLALSQTGKTEEILALVRSVRSQQLPVIALCGDRESELVRLADAWLSSEVETEACPLNLAPTASTTLALALGDALAVSLMKARGFQADHFARNHPGGSLGRRLHLRVADLMERAPRVGTVTTTATIEEVIATLTRHPLGAVLVVEGQKLIGLITDGDIRRALQKKDLFFSLAAHQVMTRDPIHLTPERLAVEALDLMENRPSQISVLPIVDDAGAWQGLLRLHDLVRSL